jgi:hypothetical protein
MHGAHSTDPRQARNDDPIHKATENPPTEKASGPHTAQAEATPSKHDHEAPRSAHPDRPDAARAPGADRPHTEELNKGNEAGAQETHRTPSLTEKIGNAAAKIELGYRTAGKVLDSAKTLYRVADRLSSMKYAPSPLVRAAWRAQDIASSVISRSGTQQLVEAIHNPGTEKCMERIEMVGNVADTITAYHEAKDNGASYKASLIEAATVAATSKYLDGGFVGSLSRVAFDVTQAVSPKASEYLRPFKDIARDEVGSTIDTIRAALSGDSDELLRTHDARLAGTRPAVQGPAVAADFITAGAFNDQRGLKEMFNKAASGELGVYAKLINRIGDSAFEALNKNRR